MFYIGLASIALFWLPLGYIFYRWSVDDTKTVSDHVATGEQYQIYKLTAIPATILFAVFLMAFLLPELAIGMAGYIVVGLASLAQLLLILVPRLGDRARLHDVFAETLGTALFVLLLILVRSPELTTGFKNLLIAAIVVLPVPGLSLLNRDRKHYLFYQLAFFSCMHLVLLSLATNLYL